MTSYSELFQSWDTAERYTVGMCINDLADRDKVISAGIQPSMFTNDLCREVYTALLEADREGRPCAKRDLYLLFPNQKLEIGQLTTDCPLTQNVEFYAKEIATAYWQRDSHEHLSRLADAVMTRKPFEPVEHLKARVVSSLERVISEDKASDSGPSKSSDLAQPVMLEIEKAAADFKSGVASGIPTGIPVLDRITGGGLKHGHYTVVAARPGVGKTTLAVNIVNHAAAHGHRCCIFTLEMLKSDIMKKFLSIRSEVIGGKINTGALSIEEIDKLWAAAQQLAKEPFAIDDSTKGNFETLEARCRKLKRQGGIDLIVLDYLQLFHIPKRKDRVSMFTEISNAIKRLALELNVSIIVVSQFNREAEKEGGAPQLRHLKESGSIEQDADLALLLYEDRGQTMISVPKNRWGKKDIQFPATFNHAISKLVQVGGET